MIAVSTTSRDSIRMLARPLVVSFCVCAAIFFLDRSSGPLVIRSVGEFLGYLWFAVTLSVGVAFVFWGCVRGGVLGFVGAVAYPAVLFVIILIELNATWPMTRKPSEAFVAALPLITGVGLYLAHRLGYAAGIGVGVACAGCAAAVFALVEAGLSAPSALSFGGVAAAVAYLATPARRGTPLAHWRTQPIRARLTNTAEPFEPPVASTVASAELPDPLGRFVSRIVYWARLLPSERRQVAAELVAHCVDGLASGWSADDVVRSFGDPRVAARLIRRAKRRCRGLYWHAWVWSLRAVGACLALAVGIYLAQGIRFWTAVPSVDVDYLAKLQSVAEARASGEPAYSDWLELWHGLPNASAIAITDTRAGDPSARDGLTLADLDYSDQRPEAQSAVRAARPWLDEVRALASTGRGFAWPHGLTQLDQPEAFFAMREARDPEYERPSAESLEAEGRTADGDVFESALTGVRLPYLGFHRATAGWLARDAYLAIEEGDGQRVAESVEAILVVGSHAGEFPTLYNGSVQLSMHRVALRVVLDALAADPHAFDLTQLRRLAHVVAPLPTEISRWTLGRRYMVLDAIQRTFSDDGSGDGVLAPDGLRWLSGSNRTYVPDFIGEPGPIVKAVGPVTMSLVASRRETTELSERFFDALDEDQPAWDFFKTEDIHGDWWETRHPVLSAILPFMGRMRSESLAVARDRDAVLLAIALHAHYVTTGEWPRDAADVVPRYLPEWPRYAVMGTPFRYALKSAGPVVYLDGPDRDDDGGEWPAKLRKGTSEWSRFVAPLDWSTRGWWYDQDRRDGDHILWRPGAIDPPASDTPDFND